MDLDEIFIKCLKWDKEQSIKKYNINANCRFSKPRNYFLIAMAIISATKMIKRADTGHSCLVPLLNSKHFENHPLLLTQEYTFKYIRSLLK